MKILGLDPGLATVGIGLLESSSPQDFITLDWCCIETSSTTPFEERLLELSTDLSDYLQEHKPDLCVIEELFFSTNQKTAIDVAQARGVLLLTIKQAGIAVTSVAPRALKTAICGDGQADKKQMQEMVRITLNLEEIPTPDDAADGLALAIYGATVGQSPLLG